MPVAGGLAPDQEPRPDSFFRKLLRYGWRILAWLGLFTVLVIPATIPAGRIMRSSGRTVYAMFLLELGTAASALLATWIIARFADRLPLSRFGLPLDGSFRKFFQGLAVGVMSLSMLVLVLMFCGLERFDGLAEHGIDAWRYGAIWAVVFLLVGASEELLARGYLLFTLAKGIGFWPAAVILSALFAAAHIHNPGEQVIGIVAAGVIGLLLSWTVWWTGSLWWAIGYHSAWDWAETFLYGVPDSGAVMPGHLLISYPRGPAWLSGGSAGPEGSIVVFATVIVVAGFIRLTVPHSPPPDLKGSRPLH